MKKWIVGNTAAAGYRRCLAIIAIVAFIVRALHAFSITYAPVSDMRAYLDHSRLLFTDTNELIYTTLFPPGYIWFLWLVGKVSSISTPQPVLVLQALMGAISCLCVAGITRYCFGARAALLAASVYAIYKPAILYCGVMLSETQAEFFTVLSVYSFITYVRTRVTWRIIVTGLLASAAVHTRVNLLVLPVFLALWMLAATWKNRASRPVLIRQIRHLTLLAATILVTVLPWSIRNSKITGRPTFLSTNGAMNLFQGNHPFTDGGWYDAEMPDPEIKQALELPFNERLVEMGKLAKQFAKTHPIYELFYLVPQRFHHIYLADQVFWPWEHDFPSNYATHPFGPRISLPLIGFTPVFALGLIGFLFPGRHMRSYYLAALWLVLLIPLLMVHGNARFHYGSDFLLIMSGSAILADAIGRVRFRAGLRVFWLAVSAYLMIATGINSARFGSGNLLSTDDVNGIRPLGSKMINSVALIDTTTSTEATYSAPLASLRVDPGFASHLLLEAEFSVDVPDPSQKTPQVDLHYTDAFGTTVTVPLHAQTLVPPRLALNPAPAGFQRIQRIVLVPGYARTMHLAYRQPFAGKVRVRNLSIHGPVWRD